jgi:hypothetical protein
MEKGMKRILLCRISSKKPNPPAPGIRWATTGWLDYAGRLLLLRGWTSGRRATRTATTETAASTATTKATCGRRRRRSGLGLATMASPADDLGLAVKRSRVDGFHHREHFPRNQLFRLVVEIAGFIAHVTIQAIGAQTQALNSHLHTHPYFLRLKNLQVLRCGAAATATSAAAPSSRTSRWGTLRKGEAGAYSKN